MLLGAMLLALSLIVLALVGTSAKQADAATSLVTKSFSNTTPITIPEGAPNATQAAAKPYPSLISAAFPKGSKVRDVNVRLRSFTHTYPSDVDVLLARGGTNRTIMSDVGGDYDVNSININLDDEASNGHLYIQGPLVGGTFQPTNAERGFIDTFPSPAPDPASAKSALSGFDTLNARGSWKLFVSDDYYPGDDGAFAGGWTVRIKAAVPQ